MTPSILRALVGISAPLLLLLVLPLRPGALSAQVRDTVQVPDTLVADTIPADTIPPPPFVPLHTGDAASYGAGVWHWDRDALLRARAVSLGHLLGQIPGVTVLRTGLYLQPEAASAFGATAGGFQLELDGFLIDPLAAPSLDLSRIPLAEIERLTVTRRIDGTLRVSVRTLEAFDARAYSRVEAATGQPDANVFRGLLVAPRFLVGPIGVAVERVDTEGLGAAQPADDFSGWVKWGWTRENRGAQLEFRQTSMAREASSPWISDYTRRDVILRARNRFLTGLVGELYAGASALELKGSPPPEPPPGTEPPGEEEQVDPAIERSSFQTGARLGLTLPTGFVEAALRFRDRDDLPSTEGSVETALALMGERLTLRGALETGRWSGGGSATRLDAGASFAPLAWLRIFGEWGDGTHGAPSYGRTADGGPILTDRSGYRLGGELAFRGLRAGGAIISASSDSVAAFGLPFDSAYSRFAGGEVRGVELQGRVPLFVDWLAAEGTFVRWLEGTRWAYVPSVSWTAAVEAHVLPLPSGNLEVLLRGEAVHRGDTPVPDPAGPPAEEAPLLTTAPARTVLNLDLVLRIIDVQAFLRYEDTSGVDPFDLPGHVIGGPRILYGVKWHFWN